MLSSLPKAAPICTPTGKPFADLYKGTEAAGHPVALKSGENGYTSRNFFRYIFQSSIFMSKVPIINGVFARVGVSRKS